MTIRDAVVSDAAEITRLVLELGYPAETAVIAKRLARVTAGPQRVVLVAVIEEQVVGWLEARASEVLESGFRVEIVGLVVSDLCRRRGVGRHLIQRAEEWAAKIDAPLLVVRSNIKRVESHRFYTALGFTTTKTQVVYRKSMTAEAQPTSGANGADIGR